MVKYDITFLPAQYFTINIGSHNSSNINRI